MGEVGTARAKVPGVVILLSDRRNNNVNYTLRLV